MSTTYLEKPVKVLCIIIMSIRDVCMCVCTTQQNILSIPKVATHTHTNPKNMHNTHTACINTCMHHL